MVDLRKVINAAIQDAGYLNFNGLRMGLLAENHEITKVWIKKTKQM
jgi:hypothetical protein